MSDWKEMSLDQRIHLIKAVYRDGMSAREIAAAIGASKGSIIGIYSRHKEALADAPIGVHKKTTIKSKKANIKAANSNAKRKNPPMLRVTMFENTGCMWPANSGGPYLFCGHAKFKGSYCERHYVRSIGSGTEGERRALSVLRAKG